MILVLPLFWWTNKFTYLIEYLLYTKQSTEQGWKKQRNMNDTDYQGPSRKEKNIYIKNYHIRQFALSARSSVGLQIMERAFWANDQRLFHRGLSIWVMHVSYKWILIWQSVWGRSPEMTVLQCQRFYLYNLGKSFQY